VSSLCASCGRLSPWGITIGRTDKFETELATDRELTAEDAGNVVVLGSSLATARGGSENEDAVGVHA
jgi:hypothetical protein